MEEEELAEEVEVVIKLKVKDEVELGMDVEVELTTIAVSGVRGQRSEVSSRRWSFQT